MKHEFKKIKTYLLLKVLAILKDCILSPDELLLWQIHHITNTSVKLKKVRITPPIDTHFLSGSWTNNTIKETTISVLSEEENAVRYQVVMLRWSWWENFRSRVPQFVECLSHMSLSSLYAQHSNGGEPTFYDYTKIWIDIGSKGGLLIWIRMQTRVCLIVS